MRGWVSPVNASARKSGPHSFCGEATAFKHRNVPWLEASGPQHHSASRLERAVEGVNLCRSFIALWIEPVHAIHDDSDSQGSSGYAANNFVDIVCVDSETLEGSRARKLRVRFSR